MEEEKIDEGEVENNEDEFESKKDRPGINCTAGIQRSTRHIVSAINVECKCTPRAGNRSVKQVSIMLPLNS